MKPLALYLDTSDLSYLALGSVVDGVDYEKLRARIATMTVTGHLYLRLSVAHLSELYRRPDILAAGSEHLLSVPGTTLCFASPESIFAAELDGRPIVLRELPLPTADQLAADGKLRAAGKLWPYLARLLTSANRAGRQARQADTDEAKRMQRAILAGDAREILSRKERRSGVQPPLRARMAVALTSPLAAKLRQYGFHHQGDSRSAQTLQAEGLGWVASLGPARVRRAVEFGQAWQSPKAVEMPACALRIAFARRLYREGDYVDEPGDLFDPLHLAYAAYSEAATVDQRVHGYTADVHRKTCLPRFLRRTGQLEKLLDSIEDSE